jgi:uncharacterized membrane protein YecN with MAPEG domain
MKLVVLYVAINALILLVLGVHAMQTRRKLRISLLDGGNPEMARAMRAHGNAAEYIPIALILMVLARLLGGNIIPIHAIGIPLTLGRLIHPFGILNGSLPPRAVGMVLTWAAIIIGIAVDLWLAFSVPS